MKNNKFLDTLIERQSIYDLSDHLIFLSALTDYESGNLGKVYARKDLNIGNQRVNIFSEGEIIEVDYNQKEGTYSVKVNWDGIILTHEGPFTGEDNSLEYLEYAENYGFPRNNPEQLELPFP